MPSHGFWAWVPDFICSKTASGFAEGQINISHAHGKTDSYRPSYRDDLVRSGIIPPARGSGSSRVFRSTRRTPPNKGRATKPANAPNRVAKPASKKTSPAASTRSKRPISRPQTNPPETRARHSAPRKQNGQFAKIRKEEPVAIKLSSPPPNAPKAPLADRLRNTGTSSPPPNAPKAPLADRLRDMDCLFSNLDVGNTPSPAHLAPFKHYVSSKPCTHYLCPVGEAHSEGLYFHEGTLSERPHNYFGANNPPPGLWEAYKKVETSEASEMDFINLQYFITCHPPHFELCKDEIWE